MRIGDDGIDVDPVLAEQLMREPTIELVGVGLHVVVCNHSNVRRSRDDERARVAAAVRIGVRRVRDVDAELLIVSQLAEVSEDTDMAIVKAVSAADYSGARPADVPGKASARAEVVRITA